MTTRTHPLNRINGFFRTAVKHYPWSFWTAVTVLAASWIPALIWPTTIGVVMLFIWGIVAVVAFIIFVIFKIAEEVLN